MSKEPDLAKALVLAVNDKGCGCYEQYFDHEAAEKAVRSTLAASPELAQVREALESAVGMRFWGGIPHDVIARAKGCEAALATLNALTGKAP